MFKLMLRWLLITKIFHFTTRRTHLQCNFLYISSLIDHLIEIDPGKSELYIFIWFRYAFDLFLIYSSLYLGNKYYNRKSLLQYLNET